jgi:hypothetical protein
LTADRASRSFEFTEREPETDRINDKRKNEDEHNHFTSSQAYSFDLRLNGVASNSVPLFVQRDASLLCYRHYPAVLKTPRDPNEFRRTLCDQLSQLLLDEVPRGSGNDGGLSIGLRVRALQREG